MAITRVSSAQMSINVALICYDTFISFAKDIYTGTKKSYTTTYTTYRERANAIYLLSWRDAWWYASFEKTTPRLGLDSPRRRDCGVGSNFPRRNYLSRRLSRCQSFVVHSRGSLPGVSRILLEERYDVSPARRCSWLRQKSENALMKCWSLLSQTLSGTNYNDGETLS